MSDLISAAIDAIQKERHEAWEDLKDCTEYREGYDNGLAESIRILIDDLPSAQPNREYIGQIKWERDLAIGQLADLGYGLGEKPRMNGDTISRQAAIDALNALEKDGHAYVNGAFFETILRDEAERVLEALPSAQPEIVRCKDCKHYDGRPCGIVDWYNTADDFCSYAERRTDESND